MARNVAPRDTRSPFNGRPDICAPQTAMVIVPGRGPTGCRGGWNGQAVAPSVRPPAASIGAALPPEGDPARPWPSSVTLPGRPSLRAGVGTARPHMFEQVDEVGIGPEVGIGRDRIVDQVLHRVEGRDRRHAQHVEPGQHRLGQPRQLLQPVHPAKGIRRAQAFRLADDLAGDRQDGLGVGLQQVLDHRIALGHPGAVVKHGRHGIEAARNRPRRCARPRRAAGRTAASKRRRLRRVAKEPDASGAGDADPQDRRRGGKVRRGDRPGIGILGVIDAAPPDRRARRPRPSARRSTRSRAAAGRHHAARRERPQRRLQPDDVVQRRRHPARSRRIGAERKRHDAPAPPPQPSPPTSRPARWPGRARSAARR